MRNVLIISPIADYGGREVEVNLVAKALKGFYKLTIFSTGSATNQSIALNDLPEVAFKKITQEVVEQNIILRLMAFFSWVRNGRSKALHLYLRNSFSNKFFDIRKSEIKVLEKSISKADLVWLLADFDSPLLIEAIEICKARKIPCVFRTTRTIFELPQTFLDQLKDVTLFVHHSENNAQNLSDQMAHDYVIVDQCALTEASLLELKIQPKSNLIYGFLGRFSDGKQIMDLIDFFKDRPEKFYIAGDGDLKSNILNIVNSHGNLEYLGYFNYESISSFFDKIDVLLISSKEESGPFVGVEAMAAGKFIVSTKVGAMEERLDYLNKKFWLKNDLSNLNCLISEIGHLSTKEVTEIMEKNRMHYKNKYTVENIKSGYANIARRILDS